MSKSKSVPRDNRGRKSKPAGQARTRWCGFAVTPEEKETVRLHATQAGYAAEASYLRQSVGLPVD
jgi:hypothetical protein